MVIRSTCSLLVALGIACLGFMGCSGPSGPKTVPVKGTLTINGQPAKDVMITFSPLDPKSPVAAGEVKGGSFELFAGSQGAKGAVPGKYKVVLTQKQPEMSPEEAAKQYGQGAGGPPKPAALSFPEKYTQATTSDKEVEVKAGPNDIKIEI